MSLSFDECEGKTTFLERDLQQKLIKFKLFNR